jgi:hypothetical protein
MDLMDENALQALIDQIKALEHQIKVAGDEARDRLGGINVAGAIKEALPGDAQKVEGKEWSNKDERTRTKIQIGLVQVRDSLLDAAGLDGPVDPKHIMSAQYASSPAIVIWALVGFLVTAGLLVGIVRFWGQATGMDFYTKIKLAAADLDKLKTAADEVKKANAEVAKVQPVAAADAEEEKKRQETLNILTSLAKTAAAQHTEAEQAAHLTSVAAVQAIREGGASEGSVLLMVVLLGAFGGSVHLLRSLVKFVGNRRLKRSWLLYYLSTPLVGAGLASIVYMMLRIGLLGPSGGSANGSANGSAISNLNLIAIYAFAALSGLFAETASNKLSEVFRTMFRTADRTKDPLNPGTSPAVATD